MSQDMNNRQAYFNYLIEEKYVAGLVLAGTEVKSIRASKVSFNDSFCLFDTGELWLRGLHIGAYSFGTSNNHIAVHDRKLLLSKKELNQIEAKLKTKGYTIVPLRIFFNERHFVKIEIGLGKGKKQHDKRDTMKERDMDRQIQRYIKR